MSHRSKLAHASVYLVCTAAGMAQAAGAGVTTDPNVPAGLGIYTCIDKEGRKLTADRPIVDCIDRQQRELGPSGTVRRVVGPTLTEDERSALEVERRKEQEERNRLAEERRRDRALMARYPNKTAHDTERANAIASVDAVTQMAAKRVVELQTQRKALDTEMEFYRKDPNKAPMVLRRLVAENEHGIGEQQRFIVGQDKEKRRVHDHFDLELVQLKRLWVQQQAATLPPSAPSSPPKP